MPTVEIVTVHHKEREEKSKQTLGPFLSVDSQQLCLVIRSGHKYRVPESIFLPYQLKLAQFNMATQMSSDRSQAPQN